MRTKLVAMTVLVVMLIGILGVPVIAETPVSTEYKCGDITNDGKVNSTDYSLLKRYLLDITKPTNPNFSIVADLNLDGRINSTDYSILKRYILGIITDLPYKPSVIDTTPPSKPTGLSYSSVTGTTVTIYWEPSSSNDVKYYAVYKDDKFVELTEGTTEYSFTDLVPNVKYEFKVCAIDSSNNISEFSNICSVTTKVNDINEIKKALLYNFSQKGTTCTMTYCGDITDLENEINQVILEAVNESNEPFMLTDGVSWGASGTLGNLQINFTFSYDDENQYMAVVRTTEDLKNALLGGLYNRDQIINIIYKGEIAESDIRSVKESILNNDTYLKYCLEDFGCKVVSNRAMGISALRFDCNYKTTLEQEEYIDSTVSFIVSKLTNNDMTDDEKEKLIHDYILTNIEYSDDEKYGNAYSALYYGKTKCDGYAMLTYKMLKAAGIENIIVTNEDHAWNLVKINGKWYHLDTTWNDRKKDYGYYKYYNLTDDEINVADENRNYSSLYGIKCTTNYINELSKLNTDNDGKFEELLKDIKHNRDEDEVFINYFKSNASLNLLYSEIVLKEGEKILLVDHEIPAEVYEDSYQWSSGDPDVATVYNGVVTAQKEGTVLICAQPTYDMSSTGLFCKVCVVSPEGEDGSKLQALSQENIKGFSDSSVQLQLKINSRSDINRTTKVTNAADLLDGITGYIGEPVNITTTSEFKWAQIGFKLGEEHLEKIDIRDLVIYWYDEKTGTIVPQATMRDEENGVIYTTVTHFSTYFVASKQIQNTTTSIAFVIDSKYSDQNSLNTFKTNIYNTIIELRKKSNVRAVFLDAKTNDRIYDFFFPAEGVYTGSTINPLIHINSAFNMISPGGLTPSAQEILGTVNGGMANGSEELESVNVGGVKNNKYVLVYTRWNANFVDNNAILIKMGDTIGLIVGKTIGYYPSGQISYDQTNIMPLVDFLLEGNYTQLTTTKTDKSPWVIKEGGNNYVNDVIVLQKKLMSLGYLKMSIDPDTNTYVSLGTYTEQTKKAVETYQYNNGLVKDGIVGKNTWNKLMLPWDEQNAQPDRSSSNYKNLLQNNNPYSDSPEVTLAGPPNGMEFEVGERIEITATGTNCDHLAVFINGEWMKTVQARSNSNTINLKYDYVLPSAGTYVIEVIGRSVPGSSGGVIAEDMVIIDAVLSKYDSCLENELVITKLNNGYGVYEELWWQDLHKIKTLLGMLSEKVEKEGSIFLPKMQKKNITDVRTMMIIQKALWYTDVTGDWNCGRNSTLTAIENILSYYNVSENVDPQYLTKELLEVLNKRVDEKIKYYDKHPYEKRLHDIAESSGFSDQLYSTIIYCITGYVEYKKYSPKEQPITKEQIEKEIAEGSRKIKANEVYEEVKEMVKPSTIGQIREQKVADMTGGKVSGIKIKSSAGGTDVDVIGPNGELIMVGGPAKAKDLGKLGQVIKIYQDEAVARGGVGVKAYFAEGTPQNVIDYAIKKLGSENVVIFK